MQRYKNIYLVNNINKANFVTHSGKFHVDDVISTVFLSKIFKKINLIRIPNANDINLSDKLSYDIGFGKFDHHQRNRNGKRENGVYYSSIGLLWEEYGKKYLESLDVNDEDINDLYKYIDENLIMPIDAEDNFQSEYIGKATMPNYIKLYNPEWYERINESKAFINALKEMDKFWCLSIKHLHAEFDAEKVILCELNNSKKCYISFECDVPYKKAISKYNGTVKYIILKSKREGYEVRIIKDDVKFKDELLSLDLIKDAKALTKVDDLIYIDRHGKLCVTITLEGAIKLIEYNETDV